MNDATRKLLALIEEEPRPRLNPADAQSALDEIEDKDTIDSQYASQTTISENEASALVRTPEKVLLSVFRAWGYETQEGYDETGDEVDFLTMQDFASFLKKQITA